MAPFAGLAGTIARLLRGITAAMLLRGEDVQVDTAVAETHPAKLQLDFNTKYRILVDTRSAYQ